MSRWWSTCQGPNWRRSAVITGQDAQFGQIGHCNVIIDERPKDHTALDSMSGPADGGPVGHDQHTRPGANPPTLSRTRFKVKESGYDYAI